MPTSYYELPKNLDGKQKWNSLVDEEIWRRLDPAKAGLEDFTFVNRKAEEEVRAEMDRESQWLKAKNRLAENKTGQGASGLI